MPVVPVVPVEGVVDVPVPAGAVALDWVTCCLNGFLRVPKTVLHMLAPVSELLELEDKEPVWFWLADEPVDLVVPVPVVGIVCALVCVAGAWAPSSPPPQETARAMASTTSSSAAIAARIGDPLKLSIFPNSSFTSIPP